MDDETLIALMRTINPDDLDFHAARYASGEHLQDAVLCAHEDEPHAQEIREALAAALDGTRGDGGNFGTVPCLGGPALAVWNRVLSEAI